MNSRLSAVRSAVAFYTGDAINDLQAREGIMNDFVSFPSRFALTSNRFSAGQGRAVMRRTENRGFQGLSSPFLATHSIISLHEYRELYPRAVSIPTLTHLGLIGPLMERLRQRLARRKRNRAIRQKIVRAIAHPFIWLWLARDTVQAAPAASIAAIADVRGTYPLGNDV